MDTDDRWGSARLFPLDANDAQLGSPPRGPQGTESGVLCCCGASLQVTGQLG